MPIFPEKSVPAGISCSHDISAAVAICRCSHVFSNYFKFAPEIRSLLFLCIAFRESAISADFHRSPIRHRRDNNYYSLAKQRSFLE